MFSTCVAWATPPPRAEKGWIASAGRVRVSYVRPRLTPGKRSSMFWAPSDGAPAPAAHASAAPSARNRGNRSDRAALDLMFSSLPRSRLQCETTPPGPAASGASLIRPDIRAMSGGPEGELHRQHLEGKVRGQGPEPARAGTGHGSERLDIE